MLEIGTQVEIKMLGTITRIEGGYNDGKVRYFITGGHCVSATVTTDEIKSNEPTRKRMGNAQKSIIKRGAC